MLTSFPVLLIFPPLLFALLAGFLPRRWSRVATGGGALLLVLLYFYITSLPLGFSAGALEWELWSQSWQLGEGEWNILRLLYAGTILLLALALIWPVPHGPTFVSGTLATLAPLSAALMLPFAPATAALLLAAVPLVMVLGASDLPGAGRAALRYFIAVTLAIPFLLLSGWMLLSEQLVFANVVWRLVLPAVALLLAGFPFHVWVRPLVREAPPLLIPFLFGLVQLLLLVFVFEFLQDNLYLANSEQLYLFLRWSGVGTAVVGAIFTWRRESRAHLLGAVLLLDLGSTVAAVSLGSAGLQPALLLVQGRFVSLLLALAGLAFLERAFPEDDGEQGLAPFSRAPWETILLGYGLLSLLGLPLTPGFGGRWALLSLLATISLPAAAILLLLLAMGALALITRLFLLSASPVAGDRAAVTPSLPKMIILLLLAVAAALALFHPFSSLATRLVLLLA